MTTINNTLAPVPQTVPGPKGKPIVGNLLEYRRDVLSFEKDLVKTYGDIVHVTFAGRNAYLIANPEDIRKVLVEEADKYHKAPIYRIILARFLGNGLLTSDGDFWRRQRKLSQPAFHTKRIQAYAETMVEYTQTLLDSWSNGETRDINHDMMRLTLNIVVKSLFNTEIGVEAERIGAALTTVLEASSESAQSVFQMMPAWVPLPRNIRNRRGVQQLDEIVMKIIDDRRAHPEDNGDLLSMLLQAEDEDGHKMTDKQLRDEVVTIVLAGHETTANALTWTWYLLSHHPEIAEKLYEEVDRVLAGRVPTLSDLRQLEYTAAVFKESMRLYPPIPTYARHALVPVELGGYTLPAKSIILISPHVFHRDSRWWDKPNDFIPERFTKTNEKELVKYAYLPFSTGPRVCIGNSFAEMEAVLIMATIAQRFHLKLDPADQVVVPDPTLTLRPAHNVMMRVEAVLSEVQAVSEQAEPIVVPQH